MDDRPDDNRPDAVLLKLCDQVLNAAAYYANADDSITLARALKSHLLAGAPEVAAGAVRDVLAERRRQTEVEGWTQGHDDEHTRCELALGAMGYVQAAAAKDNAKDLPPPVYWPWHKNWWKPKTRRENLVRAGALIIAEIERIDRSETPADPYLQTR